MPSRRIGFLLAVPFGLLLTLSAATRAQAHPADMYYFAHEVHLKPDMLEIHSTIQPGPMLAAAEWFNLDTDLNNDVTPEEIIAWATARMREFECVLDDTDRLAWTLGSVAWPSTADALKLGDEAFHIELHAPWPASMEDDASAGHRLKLHFQYAESLSVNWYYLHAEDGMTFTIPEQSNSQLLLAFHTSSDRSSASTGLFYWDSGSPRLGTAAGETQPTQVNDPAVFSGPVTILTGLIRTKELSAAFYLGSFVVTLALGSIHALTPGHGKALVAAYLIGARGTIGHAVALGGIVTLAHTGSVLIFGLITLAVSHFMLPYDLFPYLEIISGLLIVAMGAGLLWPRWRGYRRVIQAWKREHVPSAQTASLRETKSAGGQTGQRIAVHQAINTRPYDNLLPNGRLSLDSIGGTTWRSLVALGISGGLVPCPDAVAILLVAMAINRILLGLGLVVTFSFGMAAILILIGIAVVRSQRVLSRSGTFSRISPILPLVSAVIILGLGLVMTFDAVVRYDLPASWQSGVAQTTPTTKPTPAFDIGQATILYLTRDSHGEMQIYSQPSFEGSPAQLSDASTGVRDYSLSPDKRSIGYSAADDESSGIWILPAQGGKASIAVDCLDAYCSNVLWTPDGAYLTYERTEPNTAMAVPTLWMYAISDGTTKPVFQDRQIPGYGASWSPDGDWLSYLSHPGTPMVELYNLRTGQRDAIVSQTGQVAAWSPDGVSILLTNMLFSEGTAVSHLFRYDLETKSLTDLSSSPLIEDMHASWAPDGNWLAAVRRENAAPNRLGTQIWLMRPDGSDAHPVTAVSDVFHSRPLWSPDGRYLLVQQHGFSIDSAQPEVWLLDIQTGAYDQILEEGYQPAWGP